ncbi:hypothetical protein PCASD_02660 [Puccinia coronata f. sp. avenae]|uniref:Uncharacterized protein n=1 Tax=Puccinia coronata f. sp. avenae TaxID=200324 RepID=A0A2N5VH86_9BASI|nr:hypothetical protein PCASD_02660 [Puccinia coronata f. sp. avenae]
MLTSLKSKILLIHNVWTTKGNLQAFMGIAFTYILGNWMYEVCHLVLKYIAWTYQIKYLAILFPTLSSIIAWKIRF